MLKAVTLLYLHNDNAGSLSFPPNQQGRRRVLKSGTAIERHRCSPSAEGTSGGEHERGFDPLS